MRNNTREDFLNAALSAIRKKYQFFNGEYSWGTMLQFEI
jgi:hypothetical protein